MRRIAQITGRALPMRGNDIDTDRIIPARFLRSITFDGMEQHVFEDDRKSAGGPYNRHPFDVSHFQGAAVLLVNANFGCGSSREHAPQALHRWGIQVVIGESFAEIFFGNSGMIGMPCVTAAPADVAALMDLAEREPSTEFAVDLVGRDVPGRDAGRADRAAAEDARGVHHRRAGTRPGCCSTGSTRCARRRSRLPYTTAIS